MLALAPSTIENGSFAHGTHSNLVSAALNGTTRFPQVAYESSSSLTCSAAWSTFSTARNFKLNLSALRR